MLNTFQIGCLSSNSFQSQENMKFINIGDNMFWDTGPCLGHYIDLCLYNPEVFPCRNFFCHHSVGDDFPTWWM